MTLSKILGHLHHLCRARAWVKSTKAPRVPVVAHHDVPDVLVLTCFWRICWSHSWWNLSGSSEPRRTPITLLETLSSCRLFTSIVTVPPLSSSTSLPPSLGSRSFHCTLCMVAKLTTCKPGWDPLASPQVLRRLPSSGEAAPRLCNPPAGPGFGASTPVGHLRQAFSRKGSWEDRTKEIITCKHFQDLASLESTGLRPPGQVILSEWQKLAEYETKRNCPPPGLQSQASKKCLGRHWLHLFLAWNEFASQPEKNGISHYWQHLHGNSGGIHEYDETTAACYGSVFSLVTPLKIFCNHCSYFPC